MRVPWTAERSNQSILREINPEYSLERWMQEVEALIFCPPDVKSQLIGKDPDAGRNRRQKEEEMAEAEMVEQHHQWT